MRLAHPTRFERVASSFGGQRREMVRVVGIEPTLLSEPDFEGWLVKLAEICGLLRTSDLRSSNHSDEFFPMS